MDRSWIRIKNRLDPSYIRGAAEFMRRAVEHKDSDGRISCPCVRCRNARRHYADIVNVHVLDFGFSMNYTVWVNHGERVVPVEPCSTSNQHEDNDRVDELLNDAFRPEHGEENTETEETIRNDNPEVEQLFADMETPLFPGCENFSKLSFLLRLLHTKVTGKVTNSAMDLILKLLCEAFFKDGSFPKTYYEAKKYMRTLGLGYESIHACKHDCALFWKENAALDVCPICGTSRWVKSTGKGKKIPHKVLRYFPITSRLKRIYSCRESARLMRWHQNGRSKEAGLLRHPADGKAWQHFDDLYPTFAEEPRNVRLGLASDGFNPFGNLNLSYSMWPVVLIPYNMPPWMCMSESSFMMSLLIPGPQSPGKDIDVYLRPLIDELNHLWDNGVITYDSYSKQNFTMRAALLWTINDFPAYGSLSGWSTSGYRACPTCNDDTIAVPLRGKVGYIGHRRFLPSDHAWRRSRDFDGKRENREPPTPISAEECLRQLRHVPPIVYGKHKDHGGKKRKRDPRELNWSRRTIFFELPYWSTLLLRHNIDVMHVEKNFTDNLMGTLLDVHGKTKDTDKAREDLKDMKIRPELHLIERNGRRLKPPASYVLTKQEKKQFCAFLKTVKFPDGFAGNLARKVDVDQDKILGLKSHDCHVLLQRILPIGVRPFLTKQIRDTLVELSLFFQKLTSRTLRLVELEQLQEAVVILLCKLERIFPPAFFTIMVHLLIHLPQEAILGGPVQSRWMYPIERYIGRLKKYVRNKARPEGSIAEGYVVEEALTFCSQYMRGVDSRFDKREDIQHKNFELDIFRPVGRPLKGTTFTRLSDALFMKATWFILNNCPEVDPYIKEHMDELVRENRTGNLETFQETAFPAWFERRIGLQYANSNNEISEEIYALSRGPDRRVRTYNGYVVNGVKFLTRSVDERRQTQNCGVTVPGTHDGVVSDYNGVLEEVIELDYIRGFSVVLFRCKWFDSDRRRNHVVYEPSHTIVDCNWEAYKEDPFVFADQVRQVFYVQDPNRPRGRTNADWKIIERFTHRHLWDKPEIDENNYLEDVHTPSISLSVEVADFTNVSFRREDIQSEDIGQNEDVLEDSDGNDIEIGDNDEDEPEAEDDDEHAASSNGDDSDDEYEYVTIDKK